MTLHRGDAGEPTIVALVEAMKAWQRALDTTLSASGLTYVKWILLRAIARGDYVRHRPYLGAILIDIEMGEHLLAELHRDHWIAFVDGAGMTCGPALPEAQPVVPDAGRARVQRIAQSIKALHSVSVGPFSTEERAMLSTLLQRMQVHLNEFSDRRHAQRDDTSEDETPLIRAHAMLGASARSSKPSQPSKSPEHAKAAERGPMPARPARRKSSPTSLPCRS
ncbi:MarR family transcriptional regulator [Cupriavidus gilardii]|uniref:MarR family transcriptional regulator n=1 Tax=Cupriavidus gilardii TaxID=82541 RepID=UPI001ABE4D6D|nr:MarR family transcriptional regulator [Cupriavidus gilardii]MBO4122831.1 MarR family transcriptional regulator [Cupriavidus gilardii]